VASLIAAIAPAETYWHALKRLLSLSGISTRTFSHVDHFNDAEIAPQNTIILLDGEEHADLRLSFVSTLVKSNYAGVITFSKAMSHQERLALMWVGADHCLLRSIDCQEIFAIISNLFRHSPGIDERSSDDGSAGAWKLDLSKWKLTTPTGHEICLSASERNVLALLFREPGTTKLRSDIQYQLGEHSDDYDGRCLDVMISRLRRKVEDASSMKLPLRSARGVGYVFASPATIIPA
jgi:two-component system OmpR family response regulator